ncbi:chaplin [Streptomyces africanus]
MCGNSVNVVGLLNPAAGNSCANKDDRRAGRPGGRPCSRSCCPRRD